MRAIAVTLCQGSCSPSHGRCNRPGVNAPVPAEGALSIRSLPLTCVLSNTDTTNPVCSIMNCQSSDEEMLLDGIARSPDDESLFLLEDQDWASTEELADQGPALFESPLLADDTVIPYNHGAPVLSNHSPHTPTFNRSGVGGDRGGVLRQIEAIFEAVTDALLAEASDLCITLNAHRTRILTTEEDGNSLNVGRTRGRNTTVRFPGKSAEEAWKFSTSCISRKSAI